MPEGDTVFQTATELRDALVGKTLTRCDVRVPRFAAVDLSGQRVDEVLSRGKHLFIRAGAASIHSHLKMDGSWRIGPVARGRIQGPHRPGRRQRHGPAASTSGYSKSSSAQLISKPSHISGRICWGRTGRRPPRRPT